MFKFCLDRSQNLCNNGCMPSCGLSVIDLTLKLNSGFKAVVKDTEKLEI